jgi:hypothetical protein
VLFGAGDQLPVIGGISSEDRGRYTDPPEHISDRENNGVIFGFTTTVKVAVLAHCPAVGVNV